MNPLEKTVQDIFDGEALPALSEFIANPAQSPNFDPDWEKRGHLLKALESAAAWAKTLVPEGTYEVIREEGRTPVLFVDVPAAEQSGSAVFFYGHFDKQPESTGWDEGLAPFKPVIREGKLYGRGSCDDGFAFYAAITAAAALKREGRGHPRLTGLFETGEESGSPDYPYFLRKLAPRFGEVGTIFVLDSSANDYRNLWVTSSLRGILGFTLTVKTLKYHVHSGAFGGIVPDSTQVALGLIARVSDPVTGEVKLPAFVREVSPAERGLLQEAVWTLHGKYFDENALADGVRPLYADPLEGALSNLYKANLTVIGIDGPARLASCGNVLNPETKLRVSVRMPSRLDLKAAYDEMEKALTENAPCGAQISLSDVSMQEGWVMDLSEATRLEKLNSAAKEVFGAPAAFMGIGASIPIVYEFEKVFPAALPILTGVEGPGSNAHGPNEFLELNYTKKLIAALCAFLSA